MPACVVRNCTTEFRKKEENISLHVFPKSLERIRIWLQNTEQFEGDLESAAERVLKAKVHDTYRMCSKHFTEDSYIVTGKRKSLKKDAVPTIFPNAPKCGTCSDVGRKRKRMAEVSPTTSPAFQISSVYIKPDPDAPPGPSMYIKPDPDAPPGESMYIKPDPDAPPGEPMDIKPDPDAPPTGRVLLKPFVKTKISRWTCIDALHWSANKKTNTEKVKTYVKATQVLKSTRDVGTNCFLPDPSYYTNPPTDITAENQQKYFPPLSHCSFYKPEPKITNPPLYAVLQPTSSQIASAQPLTGNILLHPGQILPQSSVQGLQQFTLSLAQPLPICSVENNIIPSSSQPVLSIKEVQKEPAGVSYELSNLDTTQSSNGPTDSAPNEEDSQPSSPLKSKRHFLVSESCLDNLIKLVPCQFEKSCNARITKVWNKMQGSFTEMYVSCAAGHSGKLWESQPKEGNEPVGNITLACATLFSGSNFSKVKNFFKILNTPIISRSTYKHYQNKFLFPAVDRHWELEQKTLLEHFSEKAVCLSGDGQFDSKDNSPNYCTYTFMEAETKKIVAFNVQQSTPGTSNVALESQAFVATLDHLLEKNLDVGIISTDRHISIRKTMREKFPQILHQYDAWHMTKCVGDKVMAASKKKDCHELEDWVAPVKNHLWWCARNCNMDPQLLQEMWRSITYHCVNKHSWEGAQKYKQCEHDQIPHEEQKLRKWLRDGSKSHRELKEIVQKKSWLKDIKHMSNFCHAEEIEIFHNIALKYKPYRNHFFIDGMIARTQLAILDHNANVGRMQDIVKMNSNNSTKIDQKQYKAQYSKGKRDCILQNIYDPKSLDFCFNIMNTIFAALQGVVVFNWIPHKKKYRTNVAPDEQPSLQSLQESHEPRITR